MELIFLCFIILLVFGPRQLPEIARVVGKTLAELRRASNEFRYSLEEEVRNLELQEQSRDRARSLAAAQVSEVEPEPMPELHELEAQQPEPELAEIPPEEEGSQPEALRSEGADQVQAGEPHDSGTAATLENGEELPEKSAPAGLPGTVPSHDPWRH